MKRIRTNRRRRKNLIAWITTLAVVMGSGYFVFPAVAAEQTYCGIEEHTHDSDCEGCGIAESKTLVCELEEHTHGDSCWTLKCEDSEHTHGDGNCVEDKLACEEHTHGDGKCNNKDCTVEHDHEADSSNCNAVACSKAEHTHCVLECTVTDHNCAEDAANCVKECKVEHTHCTFECSLDVHTHTKATEADRENGCYHMTCGETAHTHSYGPNEGDQKCWKPVETKTTIEIKDDDGNVTDTEEVTTYGHIHGDGKCNDDDIICGETEHTHNAKIDKCYLERSEENNEYQAVVDFEARIAALTAGDAGKITGVRYDYENLLSDKQKEAVANYGRLLAMEVDLEVMTLPDNSAEDKMVANATGAELVKAYNAKTTFAALTDEDKADVAEEVNTVLALYESVFQKVQGVVDTIRSSSTTTDEKSNAYFSLTTTEQTLLDAIDATAYDDLSTMLTSGVNRVRADEVPGATVKVFNYDNSVNSTELAKKGYVFFHSSYGAYTDKDSLTTAEAKYWDTRGSVDGMGASASSADDIANTYNRPTMNSELVNGYPAETTYNQSLAYLFDGSDNGSNGSRLKGTMANGGGLFQLQNGYYTYNSANNAAYYNSATNNFELYNIAVVPYYNDESDSGHGGNFLPFNKIKDENGTYVESRQVTPKEGEAKYRLKVNNPTDNWYGMTVEFDFLMPKDGQWNDNDMVFNFSGDDDVWVYIDGKLVMDIGGTHGVQTGSINFADGVSTYQHNTVDENGVTIKDSSATTTTKDFSDIFDDADLEDGTLKDYTKHNFKFFYMERGGNISNCKITFNMPVLPENALLVGKDVTVNGDATVAENSSSIIGSLKDTVKYTFRIVDADGNPLVTSKTVGLMDRNGNLDEDGLRVDEEGKFSLRDGEYARFDDMVKLLGDNIDATYYVEELIPDTTNGQYYSVKYAIEGTDGVVTAMPKDAPAQVTEEFQGYKMESALPVADPQVVVFNNDINTEMLNTLEITKATTKDTLFQTDYKVKVELNDEPLSNQAMYYIKGKEGVNKPVTEGGFVKIPAGETAVITGIPAGATYKVYEEEDAYIPTVTATAVYNDTEVQPGTPAQPTVAEGVVTGTFGVDTTVSINVENESKEFELPVSLQKTAENIKANDEFEFYFDVVEVDAAGEEIEAQFDMREAVEEDEHDVTVDEDNMITVPFAGPEYTPSTEPDCKCEEIKEEALKKAQDTENIVAEAGGREPEVITEVTVVTAKNGHAVGCPVATYVPSEEPAPETMSKPAELIFKFDENTESGLHYFKVTERIPNASDKDAHFDRFVYDDTVYIITIDIQQTARGERAKFVSLTADGKVITGVTADDLPLIDFTNRTPRDKDDDTYLTVKKVWNDNGNEGNTRPDSITVKLLKDGKEYSEVEVTRKGGWTYTWSNLDDDYTWTVEEVDTVDGYDNTSMETSASGHTVTITNTLDDDDDSKKDPEDPKDPPKDKPKDPSDPDEEGDVLGIDDENVPKGDMVLADEEEVLAAETGDSNHALAALAAMIAALAGIVLLKKRKAN